MLATARPGFCSQPAFPCLDSKPSELPPSGSPVAASGRRLTATQGPGQPVLAGLPGLCDSEQIAADAAPRLPART